MNNFFPTPDLLAPLLGNADGPFFREGDRLFVRYNKLAIKKRVPSGLTLILYWDDPNSDRCTKVGHVEVTANAVDFSNGDEIIISGPGIQGRVGFVTIGS